MRESYLDIEGRRIWYSVYGVGAAGTPLLAVHGGPGFLSMPEVISDLSSARPVYFYDQYGCGRSGRAADASAYTMESYVEELEQVRRELKLDDVFIMAFSWGTALACAWMLRKQPAGVKGLILCGPLLSTPRWDADQRENISRMPDAVRQAIENGEAGADYGDAYQDAMMAYYYRHVCRLQPWPDYLNEALAQMNPDVYNTMWGPSEFTVTGTLRDLDLVPELHRITVPVLLVCGDNDEAGVKTVKDYQAAFPSAGMAVIPEASHLHHLEQPELFKAIVNGFMEAREQ